METFGEEKIGKTILYVSNSLKETLPTTHGEKVTNESIIGLLEFYFSKITKIQRNSQLKSSDSC